jgi:hypothetical protein
MSTLARWAGCALGIALFGWPIGLEAEDLGRLRTTLPAEPGDVFPANPASALPDFSAYCWECFLTLNAAASTPSGASRTTAGSRPRGGMPGRRG